MTKFGMYLQNHRRSDGSRRDRLDIEMTSTVGKESHLLLEDQRRLGHATGCRLD